MFKQLENGNRLVDLQLMFHAYTRTDARSMATFRKIRKFPLAKERECRRIRLPMVIRMEFNGIQCVLIERLYQISHLYHQIGGLNPEAREKRDSALYSSILAPVLPRSLMPETFLSPNESRPPSSEMEHLDLKGSLPLAEKRQIAATNLEQLVLDMQLGSNEIRTLSLDLLCDEVAMMDPFLQLVKECTARDGRYGEGMADPHLPPADPQPSLHSELKTPAMMITNRETQVAAYLMRLREWWVMWFDETEMQTNQTLDGDRLFIEATFSMKMSANFHKKAQVAFPGIAGADLEGVDVSMRVLVDAIFKPGRATFYSINVSRYTGEMMGKIGMIGEFDGQTNAYKSGRLDASVIDMTYPANLDFVPDLDIASDDPKRASLFLREPLSSREPL